MAAEEESSVPASFADFSGWWDQFADATDATRPTLIKRGVALATKRHSEMLALMQSDPETALQQAFAEEYRAALPENIRPLVEEHVRGLAALVVSERREEPRPRTVRIHDQSYRAYLYGPRLQLGSRSEIPLHGIVLDDRMAVDGSPLERFPRRESLIQALAQGEGKHNCPICNEPGTIPAAAGDILLWFDREEHLIVCEKALIEKENAPQSGE